MALALLLVALHGWIAWTGGVAGNWPLYSTFGLRLPAMPEGRIWQLVTYGFLHGSCSHVLLNAGVVLWIGPRLERMTGAWWMVATALAGIVAGGIFHLLLGVTQDALLVGFSGGCMALLLLLCTILPDSRVLFPGLSAGNLGRGILWAELILMLIDPAKNWPVLGEIGRRIEPWGGAVFQMGHACHFGGALTGWAIGKWWEGRR
ncbi:MAG: rhomboid family intramembrane serine protease [Luteolibacter sp.]